MKKKPSILIEKIASNEAVIGVIGMGYIGLSLLDAFEKSNFPLIGYDIDAKKVEALKNKNSYISHLTLKGLFTLMDKKRFKASSDARILQRADVIVISVPSALDEHQTPNLSNLRHAFQEVVKYMKKDLLVILQSSTYPGMTEQELLPLLEQTHLKAGKDFYLAYVPEVFDIGNKDFTFIQIPRIMGGITPACLEAAKLLYEKIGCTVVPCSSPSIAESAKLLQNSYRLLNISFINEMKVMFDGMGIDVWEVIKAANTKPFGFTAFHPSAGAGGDCIPVSPAYLIWEARETAGPTTLLETAEHINNTIPNFVVDKLIQGLARKKKCINGAKILVLGIAYKKDINDIRLASGLKILSLLKKKQAVIHYNDPYVAEIPPIHQYPDLHLKSESLDYEKLSYYDAVVIITDHSDYDWEKIVANSQLVVDTRNVTATINGPKENVIKA